MKYWYDKEFESMVSMPDCADEWLQLIQEIGIDYDGFETSLGLKSLIDELLKYVSKARKCLRDGQIFTDEEKTLEYRKQAVKDRVDKYKKI